MIPFHRRWAVISTQRIGVFVVKLPIATNVVVCKVSTPVFNHWSYYCLEKMVKSWAKWVFFWLLHFYSVVTKGKIIKHPYNLQKKEKNMIPLFLYYLFNKCIIENNNLLIVMTQSATMYLCKDIRRQIFCTENCKQWWSDEDKEHVSK